MKKLTLTMMAAAAAMVTAAPASAVTVKFDAGVTTPVKGVLTNVADFDGFTAGQQIGFNTRALDKDVPNEGKKPNGSTGNYASIYGGGVYTISLTKFAPVLSFLIGSVDSYNSVSLSFINTLTQQTTGQSFSAADFGNPIGQDGRLTFDTGSSTFLIQGVTFLSGQNSMEIDNVVSAAPEPATWAMMILGFGFAGMGLRSRRRGKLALA